MYPADAPVHDSATCTLPPETQYADSKLQCIDSYVWTISNKVSYVDFLIIILVLKPEYRIWQLGQYNVSRCPGSLCHQVISKQVIGYAG